MLRGIGEFPIWVVVLSVCFGCSSGALRPIPSSIELPTELSKELKDKFEIKEENLSNLIDTSAPNSLRSLKEGRKTKKKGKGSTKHERSFVYPVRRPVKDPMWVSERLVFSISYFAMAAGEFVLEILPFKTLDHRKVYHIKGSAVTSSVFSIFYRLHDSVESFIDYEGNFSHRFHIILDESKQKRDSLELNDSEKAQTFYWNRWHHREFGYRETKEFKPIQPFSQDSVSALYYLRTVPLPTGAVVSFPVVSEGNTFEAVCTVIRREMLSTPLGKIQTIVIKPEMKYQGILKKSGDSFLWLTDDDRRIPVRLEAKVKIGTVVASLRLVDLGVPPTDKSISAGPDASPLPSF